MNKPEKCTGGLYHHDEDSRQRCPSCLQAELAAERQKREQAEFRIRVQYDCDATCGHCLRCRLAEAQLLRDSWKDAKELVERQLAEAQRQRDGFEERWKLTGEERDEFWERAEQAEARAELAEAKRDAYAQSVRVGDAYVVELKEQLQQAEAQRDAFKRYVRHTAVCAIPLSGDCTCGLEEVLASLPAAQPSTCKCGHSRSSHVSPYGPCTGGEGQEALRGRCRCGEYECAAQPEETSE